MRHSTTNVLVGAVHVLLLAASVWLVIAGRQEAAQGGSGALLAGGIVSFIVVAALVPLTFVLLRSRADRAAMSDLLRRQLDLLERIQEHTLLSDSAKHIAYRRDERAMLARAIEEDIANEDWQAATVLVNEMRERFGYREEAEEFLARIDRSRADGQNRRITEALDHFQMVLDSRDWAAAYAEAARIARLFPESHRTRGLEQRVRKAWEGHKKTLEREFLEAAGAGHVDQAMQLLKDLDVFLTPDEAAPLQEVARGVINKARANIGLQFKLAVQDHDWATAVRIGETIIDEFPNTRMAEEVRERIDVLRARASQAATMTPGPESLAELTAAARGGGAELEGK
ncbi:MAG: hypothetical protein KJZ69_01225 [Phycisphaerales bacterium]|nr:hypothetical protein [Phycisphaerales bacterium]